MGGSAVNERSPVEIKRVLREAARGARLRLSDAERADASRRCAALVMALPELSTVRTALAYGASPEEIDVTPIVTALRARDVTVGFPRVEGPGVLGLHLLAEGEDLVRASFGILEPPPDAPRIALESLDACIVPAVAYDSHGVRLGYGGGFYDRLLPTLRPECARIGVCYDEQLVENLPREPHDALVDVVVTPTRVIRPSGERD